jgi:micrococcal nuclease
VGLFRGQGWIGSALLLVLLAAVLLRPWEAWERLTEGEPPRASSADVVRAVDGDTIEVRLDGEVEDVRYIGVDTPESVKPGAPVECFGPAAHHFNQDLVGGRRVRLVFGVERRDVYGRLLAYVRVGRRFVNAELLRRGLARTLTIPPNDRYAPLFEDLQAEAARSGRGLWSAC